MSTPNDMLMTLGARLAGRTSNWGTLQPIQKADLVVADLIAEGGYLVDDQARRFIMDAIRPARAMRMATVQPMKSHTRRISRFRFGEPILVGGKEGRELTEDERSRPELGEETLVTELYKGHVRLTDEDLEDQVEGEGWARSIRRAMAEAVSRDIENAGLNGDVNSTATEKLGSLLRKQDGLIKRATVNIVDAGGAKISKQLFKRMFKRLPREYRQEKQKLRFWASSDLETDWRGIVSDRIGALADALLTTDRKVGWSGIPVEDIPLIPDDLGVSNEESVVLLLDPKNAHWGFWRRVRIRSEVKITAGALDIVVDLRAAFNFAVPRAIVKLINVKTSE